MNTTTKKLTPALHDDMISNYHYPSSPNQTWRDYKPDRYFITQAFLHKMSVEEFIEVYYS